jgi:signal peptidase I
VDNKYYRFIFWPLWFVIVPLALALITLKLLVPEDGEFSANAVRIWIGEQKVPAVIVLFTVYELMLNHFRHSLPFASKLGAQVHTELNAETRRAYEHAGHLLDEARRIMKRHKRAITRDLAPQAKEELAQALTDLRESMKRTPFEEEEFSKHYQRANDLVARRLGRWQRGEFREYAESILIAVGVALLLRAFVVEAFKIPSGSMLPTLQIQDHIFVNKFIYGPTVPLTKSRLYDRLPPKRGDVIVFEYPDPNPRAERQDFIKRVVALPGDTLEIVDGHPIINGWKVPYCKAGTYEGADLFVEFLSDYSYLTIFESMAGRGRGKEGPFYAKEGELWVMGDNRNNSHDSRAWPQGGGVPFANIKGRAMFVWLSFSSHETFPNNVTWDRLLTDVMGTPRLPKGTSVKILNQVQECLKQRPADTFPPDPK